MSDKFLTEAAWKKFSKGRTINDDKLLKSFALLEKAKSPEDQLEALAEIEKESEKLRKASKGDKEVLSYLDSIDKAVVKEQKAAKESAEADEGEDEEDTPVLLTTKMVPLLKMVRKGDPMQVMIGNTAKEAAVLMSRRAISPARRKLLTEYLADAGTPKFITGTCVFEENAYTFVVASQAAGLAKKLRAALLKQTELRLKVRVRGEDGAVDDDGEVAEGETDSGTSEGEGDKPPEVNQDQLTFERVWPALEKQVLERLRDGVGDVSKLRAVAEFVREKSGAGNYKVALQGIDGLKKLLGAVGSTQSDPPPPPPPPPPGQGKVEPKPGPQSDEAKAFNQRLAALMPTIKEAIGKGGEAGVDIKLKTSQAGFAAGKKDFELANALLDEVEAALSKPQGINVDGDDADDSDSNVGDGDTGDNTSTPEKSGVPRAGYTNYIKSLHALRQAVDNVTGQIAQLSSAIPSQMPDERDLAEAIADNLGESTEALYDLIDEALSATDDEEAPTSNRLRQMLDRMIADVGNDELIQYADANPFGVSVSIAKTLGTALEKVRDAMPETV